VLSTIVNCLCTRTTQTGGLQLVETYKGHKDKFALFEGSLSSGSELYVLQVNKKALINDFLPA